MSIEIISKIESLPPLPKSIHELNEFKQQVEKKPEDLLQIIEKDALVTATLLKISNSAMFGFRSKVESPSRVINLLGVDFTLSVAISSIVNDLIKTDLTAYKASNDDFMNASTCSTSLVNIWLNNVDSKLKDELLLPALLQETGKFILSDILASENLIEQFQTALQAGKEVAQVEKELLGYTTSEVTAMIFKHWKLSPDLVELIQHVDKLESCPSNYLQKAQILNIIKTACCLSEPLGDQHIAMALQKAQQFGFDQTILQKSLEKLQERLIDAM